MSTLAWKLSHIAAGRESGIVCRCCSESILRDDPFGISEGVCNPCRSEQRATRAFRLAA
jgi:hypothetical protein